MYKENSDNYTASTFYSSSPNFYNLDDYEYGCGLRERPLSVYDYSRDTKYDHLYDLDDYFYYYNKLLYPQRKQLKCSCSCYKSSLFQKFVSGAPTNVIKKKKNSSNQKLNITIINQQPPIINYSFPQQSQVVNNMINTPFTPIQHPPTTLIHQTHPIITYQHPVPHQEIRKVYHIPPTPNYNARQQFIPVIGSRVLPMSPQIVDYPKQVITAPCYSLPKSRIMERSVVRTFPLVDVTNVIASPVHSRILSTSRVTGGGYPPKITINQVRQGQVELVSPKNVRIGESFNSLNRLNTARSKNELNVTKL